MSPYALIGTSDLFGNRVQDLAKCRWVKLRLLKVPLDSGNRDLFEEFHLLFSAALQGLEVSVEACGGLWHLRHHTLSKLFLRTPLSLIQRNRVESWLFPLLCGGLVLCCGCR